MGLPSSNTKHFALPSVSKLAFMVQSSMPTTLGQRRQFTHNGSTGGCALMPERADGSAPVIATSPGASAPGSADITIIA